jgi:putative transposase
VGIVKAIYLLVRAFLLPRLILAAENLALRQQVAVYKHTVKRPNLRARDRMFWVWLSRLWANGRSVLAIVQPATVIKWHRQ